ncbi:flagellar protein FliB [Corallococcus sp. H22C18031201]|nr:flagellar protein FliB [Corallococcus sp. H22C18031201]
MEAAARAPRYMSRFRCIAEACEDTCCSGLTVPISESRWRLLRDRVEGTPDAARVQALITPNPEGSAGPLAGLLGKREDGHCGFLDADKLCSLQRRHGEPVLPDGCSVFPRVITRWGEQLEMAGSLACPETARLCLLAEDALEPESVSEAHVPRAETARQVLPDDKARAWVHPADAVRAAMLRVLSVRELPLASRLHVLGRLASVLDGLAPESEPARVESVLEAFESPDTLAALHAELSGLELPGGPWAGICAAVLKARASATTNARFRTFAQQVMAHYGGEAFSPDEAWGLHRERRERLEATHGERLRQYFMNHARNHVLRHPLTESPSLLDAVFRLALRASVVRWTLLGHPSVVASNGAAPDVAWLDAAAVECFQLVAKHVEQAPQFLAFAQGLAGNGGAETRARLLVLVKGL